MDFIILLTVTSVLLGVSFSRDRGKTKKALKMAFKKLMKIGPVILFMVVLVSITLYFLPPSIISKYLGGDDPRLALFTASFVGSLALIPGFIAFPLGGVLRESGVPFMVIAAFTSSLMMVGIVTLPVEKEYSGLKVAILRNIISLCIALIVAVVTGIFYGELL